MSKQCQIRPVSKKSTTVYKLVLKTLDKLYTVVYTKDS